MFIVRTEGGTNLEQTADELNAYGTTQRQAVWGVGIRTMYGMLGFYTNFDLDSTWAHGQLLSYPMLVNGSFPAYDKPITMTFLRLWVRLPNGTWYRNWLNSQALYQANGVDIRLSMTAYNTSSYLELGWSETLTIQGFDFEISNTVRLMKNNQPAYLLKHNITSLDRDWEGMGIEYAQIQSPYWEGTHYEIGFIQAQNGTELMEYPLSQFVDITQELPGAINETKLLTVRRFPMETFNWDNLKETGFDTALIRVEQMTLPSGGSDWVFRSGMYGNQHIPQNYKVEVDPIYDIHSGAGSITNEAVRRDSSNRIYSIHNANVSHSTDNGETWDSYKTGDTIGWTGNSATAIGEYSSVEYVWVTFENWTVSYQTELFRSTTGDTLSFSNIYDWDGWQTQSSCLIANVSDTMYILLREDLNGDGSSYVANIQKSTNGGTTWTNTTDHELFNDGVNIIKGVSLTYPGSGDFIYAFWGDSNADVYMKRLNMTDENLEHWTGSAWTDSSPSDLGGTIDADSDAMRWRILAGSTSDSIAIAGRRSSDVYSIGFVSEDGGETWSEVPGAGNRNHIHLSPTVRNNSDATMFGIDYDSDRNDLDNVTKTDGGSWGSWAVMWDTGDPNDVMLYIASLPTQHNGYVDVTWTVDFDTNSTYHLKFWNVIEGEAPPSDTDPPTFVYDYPGSATQNYTDVPCFTTIIVNWSITDANPDWYGIYSNESGTGNVSRVSGSYTSGSYKSWSFANDNVSMAGLSVYFQIIANDSTPNYNSSTVTVNITSIFSLDITEPTFNWTRPNVVMGSGIWVYVDQPAKMYLNMSIKGSSNWEIRGYINDTTTELHVKAYVTNSTGESMPEAETWWDSGGTELTGSEQIIAGAGDNQPAGDYSASEDQYQLWLVVQVDDGGYSGGKYWVLVTILIYSE
jgi:hypothetical protein